MYASPAQSSTGSPCSRDYQSVASSEAMEHQSAGGPGSGTGPESLRCSASSLEGATSQQTVTSCADSNLARTFAARGSPLLAGGTQAPLQVSLLLAKFHQTIYTTSQHLRRCQWLRRAPSLHGTSWAAASTLANGSSRLLVERHEQSRAAAGASQPGRPCGH